MSSFESKLKNALDEKAQALDAATLSRLHCARNKALESAPVGIKQTITGTLSRVLPWWQNSLSYSALSIGVVAVVIYTASFHWSSNVTALIEHSADADPTEVMELIELDADLELVEDLEFYNWLEQQQHMDTKA